MKWSTLVLAPACASAVLFSAPAAATRHLLYDVYPQSSVTCSVGVDCAGNALASFQFSTNLNNNTIYIYKQGIVTLDSEIPTDTHSLSGLTYFAPGYSAGASYQTAVLATNSYGSGGIIVNFYAPDANVVFPSADGSSLGTTPVFQVGLFGLQDEGKTIAEYEYPGGNPAPGALIGFNINGTSDGVTNSNGLDLNDDGSSFGVIVDDADGTATDAFVPVYSAAPAAPEPATWMMMGIGFGAIGVGLRAQRRRAARA